MENKTLVIENLNRLEDRLSAYLNQHPISNKVVELNLLEKSKENVVTMLTDQTLTNLLFESSLSDLDQFFDILTILNGLKEKISIKTISVLYLHADFELFLNKLTRQHVKFKQPLIDLFENYEIKSIEHQIFEDFSVEVRYFKKLSYVFDTLDCKIHTFSDGDTMFFYNRSIIIDPREKVRTHKLIPFNKELLKGEVFKGFFNETEAFLLNQQSLIECSEEREKEDLLQFNKDNQEVLSLLKLLLQQ